ICGDFVLSQAGPVPEMRHFAAQAASPAGHVTPHAKAVVGATARTHSCEMLTRRAQLARLRQVAATALNRFPIAAGRLTLVAHEENTTYRHDGPDGSHLVRVHRPQRHGRGAAPPVAIRSEIAWLQAVRKNTDLAVRVPVASRDGAPTVEASAAGETRICSV